jgi:hypothetical protein
MSSGAPNNAAATSQPQAATRRFSLRNWISSPSSSASNNAANASISPQKSNASSASTSTSSSTTTPARRDVGFVVMETQTDASVSMETSSTIEILFRTAARDAKSHRFSMAARPNFQDLPPEIDAFQRVSNALLGNADELAVFSARVDSPVADKGDRRRVRADGRCAGR